MTLAGSSGRAAFSNSGVRSLVRKKIDLTLVSITLSQPASGYSANGAPHAAPALLTRMLSDCSLPDIVRTSCSRPSVVERSAGHETHLPIADSSSATPSQTSFFREEM